MNVIIINAYTLIIASLPLLAHVISIKWSSNI